MNHSTRVKSRMNVVGKVLCIAFVVASSALPGTSGSGRAIAQGPFSDTAVTFQAPTDIVFIEAPEVIFGDLSRRFPRGSRLVRLRLNPTGAVTGEPAPLAEKFFAAADPQVSFDGNTLLFAGQVQRNSTWQIWEISVNGGPSHQLTHCSAGCFRPAYLPDNRIAYTALQGESIPRTSEVQISRGDGADAHPITFGPGKFEVESVLRSGRLLLSAESPLVESHSPKRSRTLYLIDPDGSGLRLLRQDDETNAVRGDAHELADGTILFIQREASRSSDGQLAWIRPGALHATFLGQDQSGYASAQVLSDGTLLASRRTKGNQFDLYQTSLNGSERSHLLYRSSNSSSVQAVSLKANPLADVYRSILHPDRKTGRILCLDSYASSEVANGRLPRHIARVRVLTQTQDGEKVLGEAPVEVDGSFYATVPSDVPVRLLLVGAHGEVLKQQRSWMWVRPGEDRGCFGCHESQALAPENRSPLSLQRFDTPTDLTVHSPASSNAK